MFDEKNFDRRKKRGRSQRENNWKGKKKMEGIEEERDRERERREGKEQKVRRKGKRVGDLVHYSPIIAAD